MTKEEIILKWDKEIAEYKLAQNSNKHNIVLYTAYATYQKAISDCIEDLKQLNEALSESQSVSDNETKEKLCAFFNGCPNFTTDMSCSKGCGDYVEIAK